MEFCANCVVNLLQNASNGNKLRIRDVFNAFCAACLTIYPGKSVWNSINWPHGFVHYVSGSSGGRASVKWCLRPYINGHNRINGIDSGLGHPRSSVPSLQNVTPSSIYENLEIRDKGVKIIVEIVAVCSTANVSKDFGFLSLTPKRSKASYSDNYFPTIVIFTPKPGLFDESEPK
jgi:hypothetical protein